MSYYLGLDLGTSSLKAVLTDAAGAVVAENSQDYPTLRPHPGWSEQDPREWCRALRDAVRVLQSEAPEQMALLRAIGFCSAAHLPVLLDAAGAVLRPAILWSDQRSTREVAALKASVLEKVRTTTLNEPACTWTLPQLMWVRTEEPEVIAATRMLLSSKDYLIFLLTGRASMDLTSAVATLLYDLPRGVWSTELAALAGLRPEALPEVMAPWAIVGQTGEGREDFGLPAGIDVVSGALDSAAEIVACSGRLSEAPPVLRVGSSAALLVPGKAAFFPGVLNYPHALLPGHYWQAGTNAGAVSLQWLRSLFGKPSYEEIDRAVLDVPAGAEGLIFHPYLQGERAPFWNPDMRGGFMGLHTGHTQGHFFRAVMEGVAYSLRDCLARLGIELGEGQPLRLAGGVARGAVWPQILADVLGHPLEAVEHAHSAIGAAFIAMQGVGGAGAVPEVPLLQVITPDPNMRAIYDEGFALYARRAGQIDQETAR